MTGRTRFVSYWETVPGRTMPPYVALALAWSRHVLGDDFHLLTPGNLAAAIGAAHEHKEWRFRALEFDAHAATVAVVAKSDYIRLAYVLAHGGAWLDADTILLAHPCPAIFPQVLDDRLHWYSEAMFAARPGNPLLSAAARNCLQATVHDWGDPGAISTEIARRQDAVTPISRHLFDPGHHPPYCFETCDVMLDRTLPVERFLQSDGLKALKLYNTYFSRSLMGTMNLDDFLASDFLLARIFLHLLPDRGFWREHGLAVLECAG